MNTYPHLTLGLAQGDGLSSIATAGYSGSFSISYTDPCQIGDLVRLRSDRSKYLYEIISVHDKLGGDKYYHMRRWGTKYLAGAPHDKVIWAGRPTKRVLDQWISGWYYVSYDRQMPDSPQVA